MGNEEQEVESQGRRRKKRVDELVPIGLRLMDLAVRDRLLVESHKTQLQITVGGQHPAQQPVLCKSQWTWFICRNPLLSVTVQPLETAPVPA